MSKRTILMLSSLDIKPLGNAQSTPVIQKTIAGYVDSGWDVQFLAAHPINAQRASTGICIRRVGEKLDRLRRIAYGSRIRFPLRFVWWTLFQMALVSEGMRILRRTSIYLIYSWDAWVAPAARALSILGGIPVVARFLGASSMKSRMRSRNWRLACWETILAYKARYDLTIITDDGSQGDEIICALGGRSRRVLFWRNGVDAPARISVERQASQRKSLNLTEEKVLLCISRLVQSKHVERSIRALSQVLEEREDVSLVVVGDGPERAKLELEADHLAVSQHTRFVGAVPHEEVWAFLSLADIFISTYDQTNVGNPLLEAMMASKCIVTLNVGDTSKLVTHGVTGILLNTCELPRLGSVLLHLLSNDGFRTELGNAAGSYAKEHLWSWEKRIGAEIEEVEKLLSKATSR